jgi:pyridoxamine 5'-phosphate oxidase
MSLSSDPAIDRMLDESLLEADPFPQFERWLAEAEAASDLDFNAMTLATVSPDGKPSARIVLLRGHDVRGFTFFTHYTGRKAQEMAANPAAALVFHWQALERQVRIEGTVSKVSAAESDAYFAARPKGHRLNALISPQSEIIPNRAFLEKRLREVEAKYAGTDAVPRPENWGGYRLAPDSIEFWQGRANRNHDRIRYVRKGAAWERHRLAP